MRFVTYFRHGAPRLGALAHGDRVVDLNDADSSFPSTLEAALWAMPNLREAAFPIAAEAKSTLALNELKLAPALTQPGKVLCLGFNFADHAKEGGVEPPKYPSVFMRSASSLAAHGQPIARPSVSDKLDFEAELACIIGRPAYRVRGREALDCVFGYACFNDVTVRDYQMHAPTWTMGKNFDGTGALGPWVVTADELPPGAAGLQVQLRLNGGVEQKATTSDLIFDVARTIEYLSAAMTLEPGDLIALGTPSGIGAARRPPLWLKPGDEVEVEIERIGVLRNVIVDERQAAAPAEALGAV